MVQLNLVRNANNVLDTVARGMVEPTSRTSFDSTLAEDELDTPPDVCVAPVNQVNIPAQFTEKFELLTGRLGSLRTVQKDLEVRLGAASSEVSSSGANEAYDPSVGLPVAATRKRRSPQEFFINSTNGWKSALNRVRPFISANSPEPFQGSARKGKDTQGDLITATIAKCREDIMALWADPVVRAILSGSPSRVQDSPGL